MVVLANSCQQSSRCTRARLARVAYPAQSPLASQTIKVFEKIQSNYVINISSYIKFYCKNYFKINNCIFKVVLRL